LKSTPAFLLFLWRSTSLFGVRFFLSFKHFNGNGDDDVSGEDDDDWEDDAAVITKNKENGPIYL